MSNTVLTAAQAQKEIAIATLADAVRQHLLGLKGDPHHPVDMTVDYLQRAYDNMIKEVA